MVDHNDNKNDCLGCLCYHSRVLYYQKCLITPIHLGKMEEQVVIDEAETT